MVYLVSCLSCSHSICLGIYAAIQIAFTSTNMANGLRNRFRACATFYNGEYCQNAIYSVWFDTILLIGGAIIGIIAIIFLILCPFGKELDHICFTMTPISENNTLETILTKKKIEIDNLQRQLDNRRNHRISAPKTGRANERTPVLPGRKSLVYQAVQYVPFPVIDN